MYLSVYLSVRPSFVRPFVRPYVHHPIYLSIYLSELKRGILLRFAAHSKTVVERMSLHRPHQTDRCPSVRPSLPDVHPFVRPFVCPYVHQPICLSVHTNEYLLGMLNNVSTASPVLTRPLSFLDL